MITSNGLAPPTTDHCCAVSVVPIWRLLLFPPFWRSFVPITTFVILQSDAVSFPQEIFTSLTNLITPTSRQKIHVSRSFILKVDSARGSDCSICLPNCMMSHRTLDSTCPVHVCWVSYYFWSICNMIPILSQCNLQLFVNLKFCRKTLNLAPFKDELTGLQVHQGIGVVIVK